MTILDDPKPVASGATIQPDPAPQLPSADAARHFYIYGIGGVETGGWILPYTYGNQIQSPYYKANLSERADLLDWIVQELVRLSRLKPRWDGHRAKPITQQAIYGAAWLLNALLEVDSRRPQVFPLPDGGIQLEWYADGEDIEIEIDHNGEAHVLAETNSGHTLVEETFDPQSSSAVISNIALLVRDFSHRVDVARQG